jgi:D-alanine-D-alanine ligase-like ATP-grasp enzyme
VVPDDLRRMREIGLAGLAFPVIVKPTTRARPRGSATTPSPATAGPLAEMLPQGAAPLPRGVIVEEFIAGNDVTVPFIEGLGDEGVLLPVDYVIDPGARSRFNIYDYRLKSTESNRVSVRCPPDLPRDVVSRLRGISKLAARTLGIRDSGASTSAWPRTGASTCSR